MFDNPYVITYFVVSAIGDEEMDYQRNRLGGNIARSSLRGISTEGSW